MEPADVARLSLAMTAAMKAAVDFDGLTRIEFRVVPGSERAGTQVGLGLAV